MGTHHDSGGDPAEEPRQVQPAQHEFAGYRGDEQQKRIPRERIGRERQGRQEEKVGQVRGPATA
jgi:hypothetical protein